MEVNFVVGMLIFEVIVFYIFMEMEYRLVINFMCNGKFCLIKLGSKILFSVILYLRMVVLVKSVGIDGKKCSVILYVIIMIVVSSVVFKLNFFVSCGVKGEIVVKVSSGSEVSNFVMVWFIFVLVWIKLMIGFVVVIGDCIVVVIRMMFVRRSLSFMDVVELFVIVWLGECWCKEDGIGKFFVIYFF